MNSTAKFTSDWHLNDDRLSFNKGKNFLCRFFDSVEEHNNHIIETFIDNFNDGDTLYHMGDVVYRWSDEIDDIFDKLIKWYPNSKFYLIVGNYDEDKLDKLSKWFTILGKSEHLVINDKVYYLNHYPRSCKTSNDINLTGHIHGLWRVNSNMINVGVDVWSYRPVPIEDIDFTWNAIKLHYDDNVFVMED